MMSYGGNKLYNLRVPMTTFDKEAAERFGPFRVNRFRSGGLTIDGVRWRPAGFFDNVDRYLSTSAVKKWQTKADDEDAEELERDKAKAEAKQKQRGFKMEDDDEQEAATTTEE